MRTSKKNSKQEERHIVFILTKWIRFKNMQTGRSKLVKPVVADQWEKFYPNQENKIVKCIENGVKPVTLVYFDINNPVEEGIYLVWDEVNIDWFKKLKIDKGSDVWILHHSTLEFDPKDTYLTEYSVIEGRHEASLGYSNYYPDIFVILGDDEKEKFSRVIKGVLDIPKEMETQERVKNSNMVY